MSNPTDSHEESQKTDVVNPASEELVKKFKNLQNKLLAVDRRNRSVFLSRIYKKHNFDLFDFDDIFPDGVKKLTLNALKKKKETCIIPSSIDTEEADTARSKLTVLFRNLKQMEDETGNQYGFLGFPVLEGHLSKDFYIRSPIALFPISLEQKTHARPAGWYIRFLDSQPIINWTLLAAIKKIKGIDFADDVEDSFNDILESISNSDSPNFEQEFVSAIIDLLEENQLKIDKTSDLELKKLAPITTEMRTSMKITTLHIVNHKIIGSFPQGETSIYQDYGDLIDKATEGIKVGHIGRLLDVEGQEIHTVEGTDGFDESLDKVPDREFNHVVSSDSSQDQVVFESQTNDCLVVHGPPGTGKSQVIVNLASNALMKQKTILVAAQKRAALEVVYQRLSAVGLGRYCLLLSKEKDDRKQIYKQLSEAISDSVESVDEYKITAISREIDEIITRNSDIANVLHQRFFGGATLRYLYTVSNGKYKPALDLSSITNDLPFFDLKRFLFSISDIEPSFKKYEDKSHPLYHRKTFSSLNTSDKEKLTTTVFILLAMIEKSILATTEQKQSELQEYLSQYVTNLQKLNELANEIPSLTRKITKRLEENEIHATNTDFNRIRQQLELGLQLWESFDGDRSELTEKITNSLVVSTKENQQILLESLKYVASNTSIISRMKPSFKQSKIKIKEITQDWVDHDDKYFATLIPKALNGTILWSMFANYEKIKQARTNYLLLSGKQTQSEILLDLNVLTESTNSVLELDAKLKEIRDKITKIIPSADLSEENLQRLQSKVIAGFDFWKTTRILSSYFTDSWPNGFQQHLFENSIRDYLSALQHSITEFEFVQSHDIKKEQLKESQKTILEKCIDVMLKSDNWTDNVEQEIYHDWINQIERDHIILRGAAFENYDKYKKQLIKLIEQKQTLVRKKIVQNIANKIDEASLYRRNKNSNDIRWRALKHELDKKTRVKPLRLLLQEYGDLIIQIAPCWLASPEEVSKIFPPKHGLFDLVIVDEASQMASERGIPALYRGKRCIIAGDDKQLQPYDLFQMKEDDEDEEEVLNIESLLDMAKRVYKTITLKWHYRSEHQALIDFSNHAFYNGRLNVAPSSITSSGFPPIRWIQSNGTWENRCNIVEATDVVNELKTILQDTSLTVGIVTFNDQQRDTVLNEIDKRKKEDQEFEELFDKAENPKSGLATDKIFVKNIENVQGDERDLIIFSVGYARDPEGKLRLSFGSLSKQGGENRLNVAVTRARKEIMVVCSVDPEDLKTDLSKNSGPQRLRDFLVYAKAVSEGNQEKVQEVLSNVNSSFGTQKTSVDVLDSPLEEQVIERLEKSGYKITPQVGYSGYKIDIGVIHPGDPNKYILGIECDGATFHSAKSVRERDVMRQRFLEHRGWHIHRVWSKNWWLNPDSEISKIKDKIEELKKIEIKIKPD